MGYSHAKYPLPFFVTCSSGPPLAGTRQMLRPRGLDLPRKTATAETRLKRLGEGPWVFGPLGR